MQEIDNIKVAYDITSFTQNHLGGIAHVCYNTLKFASNHQNIHPSAFYRHGTSSYFDLNVEVKKISLLTKFKSQKHTIAHSLCHRTLPVKADFNIYTVHDVWSLKKNRYQSESFRKKVSPRFLQDIRKADHVVTISQTTLSNLLALDIVSPEKCSVVSLGVEPLQKKNHLNQNFQHLINNKYILYVGCLEIRKNIQYLLESVRLFSDLHLVIAGSHGFGYEETIKPLLNSFPSERIHLLRNVEASDLAYLYESAFALMLPSWEEGFGLPILEAMVHGCPVITSNRSANAEVGGDGAILVDPENHNDAIQAIEQLKDDTKFRKKKIQDGFLQAKRYSWSSYIENLYTLYQSFL